MLAKRIGEQK
jgi:phosphoenolpyruvate synthase/pyruvate phosphate dikinase